MSTSNLLQPYNPTMQHCNYDLYQQTTLVTHIKTRINIDELEGHVPSATHLPLCYEHTYIRPYMHAQIHERKWVFVSVSKR